jgi:hypothetical protein
MELYSSLGSSRDSFCSISASRDSSLASWKLRKARIGARTSGENRIRTGFGPSKRGPRCSNTTGNALVFGQSLPDIGAHEIPRSKGSLVLYVRYTTKTRRAA